VFQQFDKTGKFMADLNAQMDALTLGTTDEEDKKAAGITEVSTAPITQKDYDNLQTVQDMIDEGSQQPVYTAGVTLNEMPPGPITDRGEIPGFGIATGFETEREVPGAAGEAMLDFSLNTPENNRAIYQRYWEPYGKGDDTEIRADLQNAIGFRTGIIDRSVNPETGRKIYDVFGERRSGYFPSDADPEEKARIAAKAGATDLVFAGDTDEQGRPIDLQFKPVPAVQELRYFESEYAKSSGSIEAVTDAIGISDVNIPFTDATIGGVARALPDVVLLGEAAKAGKFIKFMDRTGYVNPYILRDLAFAQASGNLDAMRKAGRASDTMIALVNLSVGMYDFFTNDENDDVMVEGENGKKSIDWEKFPMAANRFAKNYNIPVEQAESALLFSPDLLTRTTDVAPEIMIDMGIAGVVRTALAKRGYAKFHKWLKSQDQWGNPTSMEAAVKASKKGVADILSTYLEKEVNTYPVTALNNWARAGRIDDLDIWSSFKMAGSTKYRDQVMGKQIEAAGKEVETARELLTEIKNKAGVTPDDLTKAVQRVSRAEERIRRMDAETKVPPYVKQLVKESTVGIGGAAFMGQIAQDAGITSPAGLTWTEVGGALTAAVAPGTVEKVYRAPVLLTVTGLNVLKQLLTSGGDVGNITKVPREARQWFSTLRKLDPEDYENVVAVIERGDEILSRILSIKDPGTGLPLLDPNEIGFTTAELINIPLLRVHQQAIGRLENAKIGDLVAFKRASQDISKLMVQERNSVDSLAGALDRLSVYEDPSYAERFPELSEYVTDLRKLHGEMDADLKLRQVQLTQMAEDQAMHAQLYLSGQKIQALPGGGYRVPNYEVAFKNADDMRTAEMIAQGADPDDILNAQSQAVSDRLTALLAVAEDLRLLNGSKNGDPSLTMSGIFHALGQKRAARIDKMYRAWETDAPDDTYMDGRVLWEDINTKGGANLGDPRLQNIGIQPSPLQGVGPNVKRAYGVTLSTQERAALNELFGNGAQLEMKFWRTSLGDETFDKIMEAADIPEDAMPFDQWLGLQDFLKTATEETLEASGLAGKVSVEQAKEVAAKLSLPISPREMRLVGSAMGSRAFEKARSSRPQGAIESARTRENFLAVSEDENLGFRKDFFNFVENEDGTFSRGAPVGKELTDSLREINTDFKHNEIDRIRRDEVLNKWSMTQERIRLGQDSDLAELDFRDGEGPSFWYDTLFSGVKPDMTGAQIDAVFDQKVAKAFDGKRVGDQYLLDAANTEAVEGLRATLIPYLRQRMARTPGAVNFLNNIDKGATPEDTVRYLEKMFAEDPSKLAEGLVFLDDPIFDAAAGLMVHTFDDAGNIIKAEPLLDLDEIFDTISFKNLRTVNKRVAELADETEARIIDMKATLKSEANRKFSAENSYKITASNFAQRFGFGVEGDKQLYDLVIAGDGLPVLDELREAHLKRVYYNAKREGVIDLDQAIAWAEEGFNNYVRRSVSRHINNVATGPGTSGEIVTVGEGARRAQTIDTRKLVDLVGDANGSETQRIAAANLELVLGKKHYEDVKAITDYVARKNEVYENVNITGEARALSIESWLSRVYSIARGVVSPRYVISEAVIQSSRLASQSAFAKAVANPEIARHIAEIVRTGKIPTGKEARRFEEAMITSIARGLRENEEEDDIPMDYPFDEPLDVQQVKGLQ
jgi:hypothetical protein